MIPTFRLVESRRFLEKMSRFMWLSVSLHLGFCAWLWTGVENVATSPDLFPRAVVGRLQGLSRRLLLLN